MRKELRYFNLVHLTGMPFAVKENEAADPIYIRLFGANAVMPQAHYITHLLEQLWFAWGDCHR
jgi:hypothetical protein